MEDGPMTEEQLEAYLDLGRQAFEGNYFYCA
jgi:hypothetical protein